VLNFKEHFLLAKRKTNSHIAGNVGYCPTLSLSAIRHLRPPHVCNRNRSYISLIGTINTIHNASDIYSYAHSKAVYWTETNLNINCILKESLLARKIFDFLKIHKSGSTLNATHRTNMATVHNSSSVVAKHSSSFPGKNAAPVSPRQE
jgi:hypothetical protein